jgi:RNA polymerase sigma-70 factor (ECF subfamily)
MSLLSEMISTERPLLWGMCYRMTGSAADADDLVQETFVRAMERPPARTDEPLRPWLVRVAMNLSRDHLRRRRRTEYPGYWLPEPVATDAPGAVPGEARGGDESAAARYELTESVTFAFLLAIEALTPAQRAVLILRDVFDYSTEETAAALGMTPGNVKVTLHRARGAMRAYDTERTAGFQARQAAVGTALQEFLACFARRDVAALERLLAADVVHYSDGGGEVHAARWPIRGQEKVLRLLFGVSRDTVSPVVRPAWVNGFPAILVEFPGRTGKAPARSMFQCEPDATGKIVRFYNVVAPSKTNRIFGNAG